MTTKRKLKFSAEVTITHEVGPVREADDLGSAIESHLDGATVQLTTNEAFPVRSTYRISEIEVLEEISR